MYKKAWCTCEVVVLVMKPIVFFFDVLVAVRVVGSYREMRNSWLAVVLVSEYETLYISIWNHLFCYQESCGRGPRPVWKAASKRCGFGEWIHWSRMDGIPVRVKKDMRSQKYLQSWTKVLGTVLQYSYFSVISRFPLKIVHPFRNFLAVLPSPNLYKVETRKKIWIHASNIVCGVRGGVGPVWIGKCPRNAKVSQDVCPWL